ncbi:ribonuclease E inhibitor RraB [Microbacterium sp. PA5]|uniref:ribonuclease E inhibitor RraB n=1 Tax=Microbacterium sp. PA5 TaxID=3416654 RepID=UPI003CE6D3E0
MSTYDFQMSMWPTQRDQRGELGDVLSVPREVEHFAIFARRAQAESAGDELVAAGFEVGLGRRWMKTILRAARQEALSDDTVAQFLREVIAIIERHGGDYDGWGAAVEEPARG